MVNIERIATAGHAEEAPEGQDLYVDDGSLMSFAALNQSLSGYQRGLAGGTGPESPLRRFL
ncbi:MAG: hypothetical protein WA399_09755, partial [Acidobacteriaceae bacterium]